MTHSQKILFSLLITFMCLILPMMPAYAILLTQNRIVFNPADRSMVLTIKNVSDNVEIYRFSMDNMKMDENGSVSFLKDGEVVDGLKPAEDFIRFAPQRVVMQPGQVQKIRLMVRRSKDMADGEYRSYFNLNAEPNLEAEESKETEDVAAKLNMLIGWRIPIIIRHGSLDMSAEFTESRLEKLSTGDYDFHATIARKGNMSLLSEINMHCTGSQEILATLNFKIYTELNNRTIKRRLKRDDIERCSSLSFDLKSLEDDPIYKGGIITSTTVQR